MTAEWREGLAWKPTTPGVYEWRWADGGYEGPWCRVEVFAFSGGIPICRSLIGGEDGKSYALSGEWRPIPTPAGLG